MGPHKKHALYSPDRAAGNSSLNSHAARQNNAMLFQGSNLGATQYASQGAAQGYQNDPGAIKGLQKVQQIQSN